MSEANSTASGSPVPPAPTTGEQRFVIHGVAWKDYVVLREALEIPGLRMAYYKGALELMSPSPQHENLKKLIARLIEVFALERDFPLYGYGSTTFRREARERGAEPDECYVVGGPLKADHPDIAIEVVLTSGGIDKLAVYEGLDVPEVWFYETGAFALYARGESGYEPIERSRLVPDLDFAQLAAFARREDQHEAVREYRDALRAESAG